MNSDSPLEGHARGDAALSRLLAYRTPLDGAGFSRKVAARAVARRRRRGWVLGGAAGLATASAIALRPHQFDPPPVLADLLHASTHLASSLPIGPLAAVLVVITFCLCASKAMDSI